MGWTNPANVVPVNAGGSPLDPSIATTTLNTQVRLHLVWQGYDEATNTGGVLYRQCGNNCSNPANWSAPIVLAASDPNFRSEPQIVADRNGRLAVVYVQAEANGDTYLFHVRYRQCLNGCNDLANWNAATDITSSTTVASARLAIDTALNVHVIWKDTSASSSQIWHSRLTPNGGWSAPVNLTANQAGTYVSLNAPTIAAGTPNNVYAV